MKAAKSLFLRWMSGISPFLASSASRRSLMAISVGHLLSIEPSSVGNACTGRLGTAPPDSTPRMVGPPPPGLTPRDGGPPAIELESARDGDAHRVCGVRPVVPVVRAAVGLLLEVELLDRVGLRAVRQPREEARHRQADVLRVVRLAQRTPRRVLRRLENLG